MGCDPLLCGRPDAQSIYYRPRENKKVKNKSWIDFIQCLSHLCKCPGLICGLLLTLSVRLNNMLFVLWIGAPDSHYYCRNDSSKALAFHVSSESLGLEGRGGGVYCKFNGGESRVFPRSGHPPVETPI